MYDYIKDPAAIYAKSFETVRSETDLEQFPEDLRAVVIRVVHACGMPEIVDDIRFHPDFAKAAAASLKDGNPVLCDCEMVRNGIIQRMLPSDNKRICTLNNHDTPDLANALGTTRSAAAVEHWKSDLENAVVVIGNAPTTLFHLMEMIQSGGPKPAAIVGFPVGFVGAAESKQALYDLDLDIPFITLLGRRGGSAMASAVINGITSEIKS